MSDVLEIKRGDTTPSFRARCMDGSTAVDLTTATTIKLLMKDETNTLIVNASMIKEDQTQAATKGYVHYDWQSADTDTAGLHRAEVEVTWSNGKVQTFPRDGYVKVLIAADLG